VETTAVFQPGLYPHTAMKTLRIGRLGFDTGRQKRFLERWTNPTLSRRTRSFRYGVQSCRGESTGVAQRPRELISHPKSPITIRNFFHRGTRKSSRHWTGLEIQIEFVTGNDQKRFIPPVLTARRMGCADLVLNLVMNLISKDMPNYIVFGRSEADCWALIEVSNNLITGCAWQSGPVSLNDSATLLQTTQVDPLDGLDPSTLSQGEAALRFYFAWRLAQVCG
jgi:hypothetical protein